MATTRRSKKAKPRESWHGTVNGYTNRKCRCTQCRAAFAAYQAEYRRRRFEDKKGAAKLCPITGCKRVQSKAKGNGLCAHHSEELMGV